MSLTLENRVQRLNEMMEEGRLIRDDWSGTDEQGRETACLLAALSPEAGESENADLCPAAVMPTWFAHLTPWLDDACSATAWPQVIRRYAACANLWSTLDEAAWCRVEIATRRAAVVEAMRHTSDEQVLAACRGVLTWLDADMPESSRVDVKDAALRAAFPVCAAVSRAASRAAWAAAWATSTASAAAKAAAERAAEAANVAAAREAAEYEAADRIVDEVLSALEQECGLGAVG